MGPDRIGWRPVRDPVKVLASRGPPRPRRERPAQRRGGQSLRHPISPHWLPRLRRHCRSGRRAGRGLAQADWLQKPAPVHPSFVVPSSHGNLRLKSVNGFRIAHKYQCNLIFVARVRLRVTPSLERDLGHNAAHLGGASTTAHGPAAAAAPRQRAAPTPARPLDPDRAPPWAAKSPHRQGRDLARPGSPPLVEPDRMVSRSASSTLLSLRRGQSALSAVVPGSALEHRPPAQPHLDRHGVPFASASRRIRHPWSQASASLNCRKQSRRSCSPIRARSSVAPIESPAFPDMGARARFARGNPTRGLRWTSARPGAQGLRCDAGTIPSISACSPPCSARVRSLPPSSPPGPASISAPPASSTPPGRVPLADSAPIAGLRLALSARHPRPASLMLWLSPRPAHRIRSAVPPRIWSRHRPLPARARPPRQCRPEGPLGSCPDAVAAFGGPCSSPARSRSL